MLIDNVQDAPIGLIDSCTRMDAVNAVAYDVMQLNFQCEIV